MEEAEGTGRSGFGLPLPLHHLQDERQLLRELHAPHGKSDERRLLVHLGAAAHVHYILCVLLHREMVAKAVWSEQLALADTPVCRMGLKRLCLRDALSAEGLHLLEGHVLRLLQPCPDHPLHAVLPAGQHRSPLLG